MPNCKFQHCWMCGELANMRVGKVYCPWCRQIIAGKKEEWDKEDWVRFLKYMSEEWPGGFQPLSPSGKHLGRHEPGVE